MDLSTNTTDSKTQSEKKSYAKIWLGGNFFGWLRMLAYNRFDVGVRRIPGIAAMTFVILLGSLSNGLQKLIWYRRVRRTEIKQPPLFIIGHWRSGTTWLHELLALDDRFTYPTTYVCFNPNRFLLTELSWSFAQMAPIRSTGYQGLLILRWRRHCKMIWRWTAIRTRATS